MSILTTTTLRLANQRLIIVTCLNNQMDNKLQENDIRPSHLAAGERKTLKMDLIWLRKHQREFVEVSCPACGKKGNKKLFSKQSFIYKRCERCSTIYISPRPTKKILEEFYKNSAYYVYWDKYIFPASEKSRREKIFKPRVDKVIELCKKYRIPTKKSLDVGAGFGTFCEELQNRNIFKSVVAIEPIPNLAITCRSKNIETIEQPIERVEFPDDEKFDLITSFEVIEHLFSPEEFVKHCRRLLKPGGLFVLTCPNGEGLDISVLKKQSDNVDYGHLNYFNPLSLANLLKKNDFTILENQTPGKLDAELIRKKIIEGKYKAKDNSFLLRILTDDWERVGDLFQKFISDNGLSSHLWLIARAGNNQSKR